MSNPGSTQKAQLVGSLEDLLWLHHLVNALLLRSADVPVTDDDQKRLVIETLARLLVQAARDQRQEPAQN